MLAPEESTNNVIVCQRARAVLGVEEPVHGAPWWQSYFKSGLQDEALVCFGNDSSNK